MHTTRWVAWLIVLGIAAVGGCRRQAPPVTLAAASASIVDTGSRGAPDVVILQADLGPGGGRRIADLCQQI